ncbi:sushi, von Willebrand factor type A, EGF and pentraxin domain-containing protein 1-like isoform X4 [Halichondria panicea]|uniref:sushi, von Willebrand factor type A, EGF and pentraxin domain-containing protein 1-like isoform X4 n=1 Tax=Halichondria panicea TaxID=6063 RepID=UPI00312B8846
MNNELLATRIMRMFPSRLFLCCLLGSASLVYGQQALTGLAASNEPDGTDHTGEIISFSDVGSGANSLPRPWVCYTEDTGSVLWLFPNGSALQFESRSLAVQDEVFIRDVPNFGVVLYRGPTHFSPDGEHCCVRTATNESKCVTFTPCPTLSPLSNGMISYDADTNMATYTCDPGYAVATISSITCNDDTMMWSSTVRPTCEPLCDDLPSLVNVMISYGSSTSPHPQGTMATQSCVTGYTMLAGGGTRTCQSDRSWSGTPITCELICPNVQLPPNGVVTYSDPTIPRAVGSTVTYSCVSGYEFSGGVPRTCTVSGWSDGGSPTCTVSCGSLDDPINGRVTTTGTTLSSIVTYTCNTGYTLTGDMTRTCQANRDWTGLEPSCNPVDCGSLDAPSNGAVDTSSGTTFMMTATYTCNTGYTRSGGQTRICQANGDWSGSEPVCNLICPNLGVPTNGGVTYSDTTIPRDEGSTATYSCNPGYHMTGLIVRTCTASGWSTGYDPVCTAICPLLTLTNGFIVYDPPSSPILEGAMATQSCVTGYTVLAGGGTRTCQSDRSWSGSPLTCELICPNVQLPANGVVTYSDLTIPRAVGSTVTYSCVSGYEFSGGMPRTCTVTGWSNGGSPTCTVSCGSLDDPINGRVTTTGTTLSNTATYTCNTGYTLTGDMTRTCQANRDWTGLEPSCNPVDCGSLDAPSNGAVDTSSGTTFMMTATYTCNTGYTRSGGQTRICQANGDWSGSEPVCNLICPNLGVPTNGGVTYSDTTIPRDEGSTATYTCNPGYQMTGLMVRTCTASGWSTGDDPVCTAICPLLTLTNGVIVYDPPSSPVLEGTMATQSCVTGYTVLAGGGTRTCQSDRSWSGTPLTCELICPNVQLPPNGVVTYSDLTIPRAVGSTVTYSCVSGYEFSGGVPRTCTVTGWSNGGSPTCTVSCGSLDDPINGRVTTTGTTLSNTATYTCNTGYTLTGDMTRTCQANRDWTGLEPSCNPVDCGSLDAPSNGAVDTSSGTTFMMTATYTCNTGYTRSGGQTRICQANGDWSGSEPVCNLICPNLGVPTNGGVTYSDTTIPRDEGSTATYTCNPGYHMTGLMVRTCTASGWSTGDDPVCTAICPLLTLTNGVIVYDPPSSPVLEGAIATQSCITGYTVLAGGGTRTCQSDRSWSGTSLTCTLICPNVTLPPNGVVTYSDPTIPRAVGSTVTYSCVSGYEFSGGVPRTCTASGWSDGGSPTCTVSCGSLDDPINGRVTTTGTTLSSIATYTCDTGYTLTGDMTRTCQANRDWTGLEPSCNPVDCGSLDAPSNGAVDTSSGTTFMMTATYTCNTGYTRSGGQTRICQANGDWSGSEPVCNLICPNLGVPTNGGVTYSDTTIPRDEGSTATYTCNPGYHMTGLMVRTCTASGWSTGDDPVCTAICPLLTLTNGVIVYDPPSSPVLEGAIATQSCITGYTVLAGGGTRTCQSDRSWSGSPLTCTLICPNVQLPPNGVVTYSDPTIPRAVGSTVTYSCVSGYEFSGGVPRTCTVSGWSDGGSPTCTVSCGSLDDPINGRVTTTGTTLSNIATYTCDTGYTLTGDMTRTCQANRDWTGLEPSCNPVDCGSLDAPSNGAVDTSSGTTFMMTATYTCNTGYTRSGGQTRICQANGDWSGSEPVCNLICPNLGVPTNGGVTYSDTTIPRDEGSTATYTCNPGYHMTGLMVRTCTASGWSTGDDPVCTALCPLLTLTNGFIVYDPPSSPVLERTVATQSCVTGYIVLAGGGTRTCQSDRSWSGSPLTCTLICPNVQLPPNGVVTYSDPTIPRAVGSTVTYSCISGYEFSGGVPRTCTVSGWSDGGSPTCTVSCGSLDDPINGRVTTTGTTLSSIATYTCDTGYTLTGDMTRTCQANRDWTGLEPSCNPVDCGSLDAPSNGAVDTSSGTTFMMTATYTCNTGYTRSGGQTRICQANGDWSGSEPVCNLICPNLGVPTNGGVTYSDTTIPRDEGSTATYTCNPGYHMTGLMVRTCTASGWSTGDDPVCTALCPLLTLTNGFIVYDPPSSPVLERTVATQSCVTGYIVLAGGGTRTCQSDRSWSGSPLTCTLICRNVQLPPNGVVTYSDLTIPRAVGSTVTYSCISGYEFSGAVPRTCTASGWTDGGSPTCTVVSCGSLDDPINGRVTTTGTTLSNIATYTCNTGYTRSGDQTRTCQANGDWSGSEPVCNLICPNLGVPTNGGVTYSHPTIPRAVDSTATYSCVTGYDFSGTLSRTCTTTGWSALIGGTPTCTAICDILTVPDNGVISYSPNTTPILAGAVATYSCEEGYEVVSRPDRDCGISGKWSGMSITCPIVDCGVPPMVASSTRTFPSTTFGQNVTYSCQDNFVLSGNSTLTCMASGLWGTPPMCSPVCQDLPSPANGVISYDTTFSPRPAGTVGTYTCGTGYDIFGPRTRTCQSDTTWSGGDIVCQDTSPIPVGTVATHTCNATFVLSGDATRTCTDSASGGMWSGPILTCIGTCEDLPSITNGVIAYSLTSPPRTDGSTATYSCGMMMELMVIGSSVRTCESDRNWTEAEPFCQRVFLQFGVSIIVDNSSRVQLDTIGEGERGLVCRTDHQQCCNETSNAAWLNPNGTVVPSTRGDSDFYTDTGVGFIRLNLIRNTTTATGQYCCRVPVDDGVTVGMFCAPLFLPEPQVSVPVAAIGGAVGAIVVVILVILLIIFLVLFLRRSRKKQYEPAVKNSGFSTVYTKHSDTDGVATISKDQEPTITGFPSESRANEGEEVVIKPKVEGHPPPSLTWHHDGRKVTADYAIELDQDSGISFPSVEMKHAGVYKLVASGPSGTAEKELQLIVVPEGGEAEVTDEVDLTPIPVDGFGAYVTEQHANGNKKFSNNYSGPGGKEGEHSTAIAKQHKDENRFGNILVYDDNLIILDPIPGQEDCQSDYINACYVDGFVKRNKFIASQGPLPNTLVDFWRMMWQERPPIIVMLTNVMENNKIKCQQYWPDSGSVSYGPFTVTITDQQVLADYTVRNLLLAMKGESGKPFKTTQFHFTTWPDHGVPDYATPILGFHRRVKSQHKPSRGPLLVHCSAGVGRTGTYIALDNVLDQIAAEDIIDISGTIVRARNQRMKMVQTQDQYVFIHDAILESVTCGDTQISAGDLRRQIQKMSSVAPGKTVSDFQYQFQILEQVSPNPNEVNCSSALRHKNLNRGIQYLPIENHRVFLKGEDPGRDYVNAVFVNGYKHQKAYIIAQNPLDSTVRNFWKVIYDRKCAAVVMLTPLSENGKEACSQYWPESGNVTSFGEFTIDNLGEETNTGFVMRQLSVLNKKTKQTQQIIQIQILDWKSTGACANLKIVTDVNEEVIKVQRRTGNKAIVVHCSDTATRSGMYCSIATTIDRCKTEGVVDVFQVVKALRVHKPGAVPSVDNYKDVFEALLVYLDSFDTYANFL